MELGEHSEPCPNSTSFKSSSSAEQHQTNTPPPLEDQEQDGPIAQQSSSLSYENIGPLAVDSSYGQQHGDAHLVASSHEARPAFQPFSDTPFSGHPNPQQWDGSALQSEPARNTSNYPPGNDYLGFGEEL
ncbi:MAG: hypothetical protein M1834_005937 [Cirrosporium novae-zelandiae]|nr:MAG: hypothetical protein M1834_005937 [Cirrosporium novae-zelandiae]